MKHLIIGAGNLGKDLLCELTKEHETLLLSQSNGDNVKDLSIINKIEAFYPNCVWVAIGGGSVQECKPTSPTYKDAKYINQDFPAFLNCCLPKSTKVVFFSTDYAANEKKPNNPLSQTPTPRSEYAKQKIQMENIILNLDLPNRVIIRVGSLYGKHKPERTFPGKIQKLNGVVRLPLNSVTPTSTGWLAKTLAKNAQDLFNNNGTTIHHCAPSGNTTVRDWGRIILPNHQFCEDEFYDMERPITSKLGCSFTQTPDWLEVWENS